MVANRSSAVGASASLEPSESRQTTRLTPTLPLSLQTSAYRTARRWSYVTLSERSAKYGLRVPPSTIRAIEKGVILNPTSATLFALARAFELSTAEAFAFFALAGVKRPGVDAA